MWNEKYHHRLNRDLALHVGAVIRATSFGNEQGRSKGRGIEFHGLRDFEYGDSAKNIDWRASARISVDGDRLVVREFIPEFQIRVLVIADENQSMFYPKKKSSVASNILGLIGYSALSYGNIFGVYGFGGENNIFSGFLSREDDLEDFLNFADSSKKRKLFYNPFLNPARFLDQIGVENTVLIFITDLSHDEKLPGNLIRSLGASQKAFKSIAVILDEWSSFKPESGIVVLRRIADEKSFALDMRKNGGIFKEAEEFQKRVSKFSGIARSNGMAVISIPLQVEDAPRFFQKKWNKVFDEN